MVYADWKEFFCRGITQDSAGAQYIWGFGKGFNRKHPARLPIRKWIRKMNFTFHGSTFLVTRQWWGSKVLGTALAALP